MGLTEEQKRRVESVFQEALNLPQEQRSGYLAQVCSDDDFVRQEAASLLRHYESADELRILGTPHEGPVSDPPLPERIGPYEVLSRLGRGGMGVVYLARDPRLGRKVAIKILSPAIDGTPGAMERLRREALAASALNHPNILTVYEFGEAEGGQYIVSEYVEGTSLRELIGTLSPEQAVDYARQIGNALAAAHKAGIIHRDIKPENIMVRPDGYVKVLDFGLAKATPLQGAGTTSIQQRLAQRTATVPGMLIGTISYMSPEQLRGQEVDQRTDIWSWGVVLYEMLTGDRPFRGETPSDVVAAVLQWEPPIQDAPRSFSAVLSATLVKDRNARVASMAEALAQLNDPGLQQESGYRSGQPYKSRSNVRLRTSLYLLALSIVLGSAWEISRLIHRPGIGFKISSPVRLTNTGNVATQGISPDGDYVAFALTDGSRQALRLKQISTGADRELIGAQKDKFVGITFASGYIYFVLKDQSEEGRLFRVPLIGGNPKLMADDVDSPVSISPDTKRLVFMRRLQDKTELMVMDVAGSTPAVMAHANPNEYFWNRPLWSPDNDTIIAQAYNDANDTMLYSIHVADGSRQRIPLPNWSFIRSATWLDRDTFLVAAVQQPMSRAHLVEVSLATGATKDLSSDLSDYLMVDASLQSHMVAALQRDRISAIWIAMLNGRESPRKLTTAGSRFYGVSWSPSGKLISQSEIGGKTNLWLIDPLSGAADAITEDDAVKMLPEASPDGRYVLFTSNRDGAYHLWRIDTDGRNAVRLTSEIFAEEEGVFTQDGKSVIFTRLENGQRRLWRVPTQGGVPLPVTSNLSRRPSVSPDGRLIACEYWRPEAERWIVALLDAKTGAAVQFFPNLPVNTGARLRWTPDGKSLLYASSQEGASNIWKQNLNGGIPVQITHFEDEEIFFFGVSPDGRFLACIRGRNVTDVVLMSATH
jgi:eukaryotic-like serine/threonine-protein kinase